MKSSLSCVDRRVLSASLSGKVEGEGSLHTRVREDRGVHVARQERLRLRAFSRLLAHPQPHLVHPGRALVRD